MKRKIYLKIIHYIYIYIHILLYYYYIHIYIQKSNKTIINKNIV